MDNSLNTETRFIVKNSQPIPIPGKKKSNIIEYSLKQNFFNPNKSSPPNSWNTRLLSRLEICNNNNINL
jgi:hypothetical protein